MCVVFVFWWMVGGVLDFFFFFFFNLSCMQIYDFTVFISRFIGLLHWFFCACVWVVGGGGGGGGALTMPTPHTYIYMK